MARFVGYYEIIGAPYAFYEVDRIRLRQELKLVEAKIKEIQKQNSIGDFKLIKPLCHTARWMNGVLTLMNHHIPPIRSNHGWRSCGIGGYVGAWKARQEIREFIQGRNIPKGSKSMQFSIAQIMGTQYYE